MMANTECCYRLYLKFGGSRALKSNAEVLCISSCLPRVVPVRDLLTNDKKATFERLIDVIGK